MRTHLSDFRASAELTWYLSPAINSRRKLTLATGAALAACTTATNGAAWSGRKTARLDCARYGGISNRRAGDVGGTRSEADGGLDVGPKVLDGLSDGADAGAARHSGDADGDA